MVTQAVMLSAWQDAAHMARAMVLPAPGGPVTVVMEPRAPAAMSRSIRGRSMSHSGMPGTVTLDVRSGSPTAACRPEPAVVAMAALVAIAITFSHRRARGSHLPRPGRLPPGLACPRASPRAWVLSRTHLGDPSSPTPDITQGDVRPGSQATLRITRPEWGAGAWPEAG